MRSQRHCRSVFGADCASIPCGRNGGFTLIEVLLIAGIIGLLVSLVVSSLNSVGAARGLSRGAYDTATLLELARSEAVTRRTYVWVGFQNTTATAEPELRVGAVFSRDGTSDSSSTNLQSLARVLHLKQTALTPWSDLKATTRALMSGTTPESIASNTTGISFTTGVFSFAQATVTFTPMGQALLSGTPTSTDGYVPLMDISLRHRQGQTIRDLADDAAIILNGATGTPAVLCLQ
jgi:Tfp pilus assembly protein FimT